MSLKVFAGVDKFTGLGVNPVVCIYNPAC